MWVQVGFGIHKKKQGTGNEETDKRNNFQKDNITAFGHLTVDPPVSNSLMSY